MKLSTYIPIRGRITINPLVIIYMELAAGIQHPNIIKILVLVNCDPNEFWKSTKIPIGGSHGTQ